MTATAATLIPQYTDEFIRIYRDGLLEDIIPFWTRHSVDRECGGFLTSLDRDGSVIDTDKAVWLQGRFVWMLSALHNTVAHYGIDPKPEWLEIAQHGIDFLDAHCFDDDGRMFFLVTREGRPLRKRRYIFSETFTTIAFAAYAQATGDAALLQRAVDLFKLTLHYLETPGLLPPKTDPQTRPMKGIAVPMILIATAQVLREAGGDAELCNTYHRPLHRRDRARLHAPGAARRAGSRGPRTASSSTATTGAPSRRATPSKRPGSSWTRQRTVATTPASRRSAARCWSGCGRWAGTRSTAGCSTSAM